MIFSWFLSVLNTQEEDEATVEVNSLSKLPLDGEILAPSPCFNLSKADLHIYSARKMGEQLPNDFWTLSVIIFEGQCNQNPGVFLKIQI